MAAGEWVVEETSMIIGGDKRIGQDKMQHGILEWDWTSEIWEETQGKGGEIDREGATLRSMEAIGEKKRREGKGREEVMMREKGGW